MPVNDRRSRDILFLARHARVCLHVILGDGLAVVFARLANDSSAARHHSDFHGKREIVPLRSGVNVSNSTAMGPLT